MAAKKKTTTEDTGVADPPEKSVKMTDPSGTSVTVPADSAGDFKALGYK